MANLASRSFPRRRSNVIEAYIGNDSTYRSWGVFFSAYVDITVMEVRMQLAVSSECAFRLSLVLSDASLWILRTLCIFKPTLSVDRAPRRCFECSFLAFFLFFFVAT